MVPAELFRFNHAMSPERFDTITSRYASLRILLLGDFCLDRYLEIDPARSEVSIETGLPVHNVVRVRSQPGGSGTILNNLVALGVGTIHTVGFCGDDGEGYELQRALRALASVQTGHFLATPLRRTFTYCKPLVLRPEAPPQELNRLDSKNWEVTPAVIEDHLIGALQSLAPDVDAIIVLDQVDLPDTGVVTRRVRNSLGDLARKHPSLLLLADSRQGLAQWPNIGFKMNAVELGALLRSAPPNEIALVERQAAELSRRNGKPVFVTLSERGIVGALPSGPAIHVSSLPVRSPIDIVGAGDSVTANLTTALAAGAELREAMQLAMAGANEVVHQLGTTGTASIAQLRARFGMVTFKAKT